MKLIGYLRDIETLPDYIKKGDIGQWAIDEITALYRIIGAAYLTEEELASPEIGYPVASRGIGGDWVNCFCCGHKGETGLNANISFFVESQNDGEKIVDLFQHGAYLDYREYEPNWIQVKVGACPKHVHNLEFLDRLTRFHNKISNHILLQATRYKHDPKLA